MKHQVNYHNSLVEEILKLNFELKNLNINQLQLIKLQTLNNYKISQRKEIAVAKSFEIIFLFLNTNTNAIII